MTPDETQKLPYFPIHSEMLDVANGPQRPINQLCDAPLATAMEIAKLLHKYELSIVDEDRALMIEYGGWLLQLGRELGSCDAQLEPA